MPGRFHFDIRQSGRRIVWALVVLVALNLAATLLVVRPKVRDLEGLQEASAPRREAKQALIDDVESREAYLAALDQARLDLATLRDDVLSTKNRRLVPVQLEVASLADEFGVRFEQVRNKNAVLEDEELEYFGMVVPLEGGYANLRQFIQAVESSEKFLVIEQVALDEAKDGGALLQLNITVATYFDFPIPDTPAGGGA